MVHGVGALVTLLVGFIGGYILYTKTRFRAGGILATPILALYVADNFFAIVPFGLAVLLTYLFIQAVIDTYLVYGRRLYYLAMTFSLVITWAFINDLNLPEPAFFTILPGIIAYNFHKENDSVEHFRNSVITWALFFTLLSILAYSLQGVFGL